MRPFDIDDDDMVEQPMLTMDGYDDCIAGVIHRFGTPMIVCYDIERVLAKLMGQGMTEAEAEEWFEVNQLGAWVGETTPCFLQRAVIRETAKQ